MRSRSLRQLPAPLLPPNARHETPIFVVQTGLLREKLRVLGAEVPVQIRDVVLWRDHEEAQEWGILYARQTLADLDPEERGEVIGRYETRVNEDEFERLLELKAFEAEATETCKRRVAFHKLPMKVLGTDWRFDKTKVTFHFAAENRVDFRLLVRDLAAIFHCRIELHQVGVRDETAILGGMGSCGRELCCHQHLDSFPSVSIKMARAQNLPLSPSKTSGVCGRLKCCLRYEYDLYEEMAAVLPPIGERGLIAEEPAEIVQHLPLTGLVVVRYEDGRRDTLTPAEWTAGMKDPARKVRAYAGEG